MMRPVINTGLVLLATVLGVALSLQVRHWRGRLGTMVWPVLFGLAIALGKPYAVGPLDFLALAVLLLSLFVHWYYLQQLNLATY